VSFRQPCVRLKKAFRGNDQRVPRNAMSFSRSDGLSFKANSWPGIERALVPGSLPRATAVGAIQAHSKWFITHANRDRRRNQAVRLVYGEQ